MVLFGPEASVRRQLADREVVLAIQDALADGGTRGLHAVVSRCRTRGALKINDKVARDAVWCVRAVIDGDAENLTDALRQRKEAAPDPTRARASRLRPLSKPRRDPADPLPELPEPIAQLAGTGHLAEILRRAVAERYHLDVLPAPDGQQYIHVWRGGRATGRIERGARLLVVEGHLVHSARTDVDALREGESARPTTSLERLKQWLLD